MVVGKVGDQAREFDRMCITIRLSAFPVRMSYKVKVRSVPKLARTEASDILKRTEVMVSVDVGKERSEIGALLKSVVLAITIRLETLIPTSFHPKLARRWKQLRMMDLSDDGLLSWNKFKAVSDTDTKTDLLVNGLSWKYI
jgi:hypothetical protein